MKPNITNWSGFELTNNIAELAYPDVDNPMWVYELDYLNYWNDLIPLMIKHDVHYPINSLANQREMCEALYCVMLAKSEVKDNE